MNTFNYADHGLIPSSRPTIPGGRANVGSVLDWGAATYPNKPALIGRSARFTYGQLSSVVNNVAQTMLANGIRRFDRVAASLPNDADIVVAFLAAMRIGAIWVGLPRILTLPEKLFILEDAGASLLLADKVLKAQLEAHPIRSQKLKQIWDVDAGDPTSEWANRLSRAPQEQLPLPPVDPFEPAAIAYTSGTTGHPKGAVHSQHNLLLPGAVAVANGEFGPDDNTGVVLPLTISNMLIVGPLTLLQAGGTTIAIDRTDAEGLSDWIHRERILHLIGVPTIYYDLLSRPGISEFIDSLVRPECGGADLSEDLRRLFFNRFGREVEVTYGLTEAPARVTTHRASEKVAGTCGQACPHLTIEIRNDHGAKHGPGEVGEIWVGAQQTGPFAKIYTPFLGYWMRPEATQLALHDGMLSTGDIGSLDAGSNLSIKGRLKELILRGGANVYPAEIERVLGSDKRIKACAVIGVPDVRLGERVVAFVQFESHQQMTVAELQALCDVNLARYKIPSEFRLVNAFPRNAMGKIVKPKLAAMMSSPALSSMVVDEQTSL
jgi:long-chain acyl-CoA synthetase